MISTIFGIALFISGYRVRGYYQTYPDGGLIRAIMTWWHCEGLAMWIFIGAVLAVFYRSQPHGGFDTETGTYDGM